MLRDGSNGKAEGSGLNAYYTPVEARKSDKYFILFLRGCFGTYEIPFFHIAANACDNKLLLLLVLIRT